jgi:hypothetical protein
MLRRDEIMKNGDFNALRAFAAEMGASALIIDRRLWNKPLPEARPLWENQYYVAFSCC